MGDIELRMLEGSSKGLLKLKKKIQDEVEERSGRAELSKKIGDSEVILGCDVSSDVDSRKLNIKSCDLRLKTDSGETMVDPSLIPMLQLPNTPTPTQSGGIVSGEIKFKSDKTKEPETKPRTRIEKIQKTTYDRLFHREGRGQLSTTIANSLKLDVSCDGSHDKINKTAEFNECTVKFTRIAQPTPPVPTASPAPASNLPTDDLGAGDDMGDPEPSDDDYFSDDGGDQGLDD